MMMMQVEITLDSGMINISQEINGETESISITTEQAELFCEWIMKAAKTDKDN